MPHTASLFFSLTLSFILHFWLPASSAWPLQRTYNGSSATAIFVFGDSTADPGNNNYINTVIKANFPPYGRDFAQHRPTGRFTNGKLVADMLASAFGVKEYIPAYLDPTLTAKDLLTGVSFASADSGYDSLTAEITGVIPVDKQIEYFKEYVAKVQGLIGKGKALKLIKGALFALSAGTNDFGSNYFLLPLRSKHYNTEEYQQFLLNKLQGHLQALHEMGAEKILVIGLPPVGCLPEQITLNFADGCVDYLNGVAVDYNLKLVNTLSNLQATLLRGSKINYGNIYQPLLDMIGKPEQFENINEVNN
ncbi:hypothetical protein AMTR_s00021p00183530 [Amborella trichopoda]|uniref:SGNH hydrolase-type esterase domain-containing protein n=1 Tax=Amborella trichopoda TaxID=13333 RepID=W1PVE5_AMBTC|nr:hypothetical protein AMTR_s00021p00183530 [Amborella trichopoda]